MTGIRGVVDRIRRSLAFLLTQLNAVGTLVLYFIIEHPTGPSEIIDVFPTAMQPALKLAVPLIWFFLVQYAKKRAMRAAANGSTPAA